GALRVGERADHQARGLPRDRLRQSRMSMAEARDGDPREKVDVDISIGVGERGALAVIDRDTGEQRNALAAWCDVGLFLVENFPRPGSGNRGGYRGEFSLRSCHRRWFY